jgi:AcrR family transcriptional regulator
MPRAAHAAPRRARRSDYERTRRRLLDSARSLMAERGPESLTVSAVAHAAELNRTTAYQHFRTRDELVRAVSEEIVAEVVGVLADPRPLPERIDSLVTYTLERPEIARLALHLLLSESPFPRAAWNRAVSEVRKIAESAGGREGVDPEMLLHVLMASGILWPLHARSEFEDAASARRATERLARELKRLLLFGLLRPEAWPELVASLETDAPASGRRKNKRRDP